ncbi:hypothetical protein RLDS_12550 [Sphingobium lactosutens DS20]|uniref:Tc1-like transposase DDE domain-containing protein n=1 Tax=Sphingobium lactosutens DS20 TaxID=1331060 RepID=T0IZ82_9SPHN|nr:hypothetical protein RLDS_12550 [Sphingobium lactosutens DS20]
MLAAGDVIIMDNLGSYKGQAIRNCRTGLLFLPPYSPDFNPID